MKKHRLPSGWRFLRLLVLALCAVPLLAQTTVPDEWTWVGGSSTVRDNVGSGWAGVYGSLGLAANGNIPGSRHGAVSWTDSGGHFWLFGGVGYDASGTLVTLNDLWEYDPAANQWTWISGSNVGTASGVYGTLRTPAVGNVPGGRGYAARWIDSRGNLWLFGGTGSNPNNTFGVFNDLWEFDVTTKEWTWISGCNGAVVNNCNNYGVYGTLETPSATNVPGVRSDATSWIDSNGDLWLFGGWGLPLTNTIPGYFGFSWGVLNDLWKFDPSLKQWTWMGGSDKSGQSSVYGTLGTPLAANIPGSRSGATTWVDTAGNIWLFGGSGVDASQFNGLFNDLWELNLSTQEWTWISGSNQEGERGVYGILGTPSATTVPGSRMHAAGWVDHGGRLWLFGGSYLDAGQNWHAYDDLWMFDPSTNLWSWMGGSSVDLGYQYGWPSVYGVLGTPSLETIPGSRDSVANWSDSAGNFWLFGGLGVGQFDLYLTNSHLNDLWEYQPGAAAAAKSTPTITVTPALSSIKASQDLTVNITVNSAPGNPTPTGSLKLTAATYTSTYTALTGGGASIVIPAESLSPGTVTISVIYSGDAVYNGTSGKTQVTVASAANFQLACTPISLTMIRGATTGNTATVTVSPSGGFVGNVLLTASFTTTPTGATRLPSVGFVGSPVNISGPNTGTAILTISTTAPIAAAIHYPKRRGPLWYAAGGATLACALLFGLSKRRQRWQAVVGTLALLVASSWGVLACGTGGGSTGGGTGGSISDSGTSLGNYVITIEGTATTGPGQSIATVGLTVQ
jgi:N-acetylneuraminic acid mutarotase